MKTFITRSFYVGQGNFIFIFVFWCGVIKKLQNYGVIQYFLQKTKQNTK